MRYNQIGLPPARTDPVNVAVVQAAPVLFDTPRTLQKLAGLAADAARQGAELLVFRGGQRVLSSPQAPALLFEVNDATAAPLGSSSVAVKQLLREYGYRVYSFEGGRLAEVDARRPEQ